MGRVMSRDTIAMAADHAGYPLKENLKADLVARGLDVLDLGTNSADSVDYPDFAAKLAAALKDGKAQRGVLICGTGIGISMAANRYSHIRAAVCSGPVAARFARQHNDANGLCLGARLIGPEIARESLFVFLDTAFEGGRHSARVGKLGAVPVTSH
jgi:ribose 5-phosphate isomerase B